MRLCSAVSEMSVRPSIRMSNSWIVIKRKKLLPTYWWWLYHMKYIDYSSFPTRKWLVADDDPCTWNIGQHWPRSFKNTDFQSIFARSALAVTPSERNSVIINRKNTTRFPVSPRRTAYIACKPPPPQGAQKRKIALFRLIMHFPEESLLHRFFLWKTSATELL